MRIIMCATLVLVGTAVHGADVYRSTNSDGTVTYSDRPQDQRAQYVHVPTPVAAPQAGSSSAAPARLDDAAALSANPPPADESPDLAAMRAEFRARNCSVARERVEKYAVAHRLYRTLANGEREYLNDAEIDDARARAAADVDTWCD